MAQCTPEASKKCAWLHMSGLYVIQHPPFCKIATPRAHIPPPALFINKPIVPALFINKPIVPRGIECINVVTPCPPEIPREMTPHCSWWWWTRPVLWLHEPRPTCDLPTHQTISDTFCKTAWCTNKDLRHVRTWQAGWIMQRNVVARSHKDGTQLAGSWRAPIQDLARANSSVGARQVLSWRAPSGKLARQLPIWRAPTPLLAPANPGFGAPTYHLARAKTMPSQCLLISSTACCPDSDSPRSLPPACAWGQAGAQPGACPAGPSAP